MVVNLTFSLEACIKQLIVEASSEEEAVDKLRSMTLAEIIEEGAHVDSEMKITDVEYTVEEYTAKVKVTNIEYDLDPETIDDSVIEYLKNLLPRDMTLTITGVTPVMDIEDLVKDEILNDTNYEVKSMEFQVIETK